MKKETMTTDGFPVGPAVACRHGFVAVLALAAWGVWPAAATATDGTWTGVSGDWSNPAIWEGGVIPGGSGATASFTADLTGSRTVFVDSPVILGGLVFTDTASSHNLTLAASGGQQLTLETPAGRPSINVTDADRRLAITGVVGGLQGLIKTGPGRLFLNNQANVFSGELELQAGSLQLNGDGNLGDAANGLRVTGPFSLYSNFGGTLVIAETRGIVLDDSLTVIGQQGQDRTIQIDGTISGPGGLAVDGPTTNLTLAGANSFSGAVTVAAGGTAGGLANDTELVVGRSATDTVATLGDGGNAVTLAAPGGDAVGASVLRFFRDDYTFAGPIDGGGVVSINPDDNNLVNGSTITLTGTNTYTGGTIVRRGGLAIPVAGALAPGNLRFDQHGVLLIGTDLDPAAAADFTRPVGTAAGEVQWTNGGGFAAIGADRTIDIGGAGGGFSWEAIGDANALFLGHPDADATAIFTNPLLLTGTGNRTLRVFGGAAAVAGEISGSISGADVGIQKNDDGVLLLSGANTYTGSTRIAAGGLRIEALEALGTTSEVVVAANGGRLELNAPLGGPVTTPLTVRGNGGTGNPGSLANLAGDNTWAGPIRLSDDARIKNLAAGTTLTLGAGTGSGGGITAENHSLTVDGSGDVVIADPLDLGAGGLIKAGPGSLVLAAANPFTGPTDLRGGTLEVAAADALAASSITINPDSTLAVAAGITLRSPAVSVSGGTLTAESLTIAEATGIGSLAVTSGTIAGVPTIAVSGGGEMTLPADGRLVVAAGGLTVEETGGRLDLGAGAVTIAAGGGAGLREAIIAGRNGGGWNGSAGILSAAAADSGGTRAVGYVVAGDGSAEVSFAAPGDVDLSGTVDVFDLVVIDAAGTFGSGEPSVWSQGDFNYDGLTTIFDLVAIDTGGAFGAGNYFPAAPTDPLASVATVPEPAGQLLLMAALAAVVKIALVAAAVTPRQLPAAQPNIIHIFADDLGYGSLGFTGSETIQTPNLDALATTGMVLGNAYASTLCAPSRASLLTGFHNGHARMDRNGNIAAGYRDADVTVAELVREAGYATAVFGKWGFGGSGGTQTSSDKSDDLAINPTVGNPETLPAAQGYDEFYGYLNHGRAHRYFISSLWENDASAPGGVRELPTGNAGPGNTNLHAANTLDLVAARSEQYIRDQAGSDKPFYMQMNYTVPHNDLDWIREVPDGHGVYADQPWSGLQKDYAAMITRMDAAIGRLVDTLRDEDLLDDTIIFFTSDNGATPELGGSVNFDGSSPARDAAGNPVNFHDAGGPYRGGKRDLLEGGIHVPMLVSWVDEEGRSRLAGPASDLVTDVADFLPTIAELTGSQAPVGIDGVSILPTLLGTPGQRERGPLVFEHHEGSSGLPGIPAGLRASWAVIDDGMKLIRYLDNQTQSVESFELYDLAADPTETVNLLAGSPAADVLALRDSLRATALAQGVEQPDAYAAEMLRWTGGDGGRLEDAANWTGSAAGSPDGRSSAVLANPGSEPATAVARLTTALGLEVRGDEARQTLRVARGGSVSGVNEVRLAKGGRIQLDAASLASDRWVDILPGGELTGQGDVAGDVWNAGRIAPGLPTDLPADTLLPGVETGPVTAVSFDFSGVQDDSPLLATSVRSDYLDVVSGFAFGPGTRSRATAGTTATDRGDEFNVSGWSTGDLAAAVAGDHFVTFTVAPVPGLAMTLDAVAFDLWRNGGNAPTDYAVLSSLGGFTDTAEPLGLFTVPMSGDPGGIVPRYTVSPSTSLPATTGPLELRLYGWNANGSDANTHITGVSLWASFESAPGLPLDPAGTLALAGDYRQAPGGVLAVELMAAGRHDRLAVAGRAMLAGSLEIDVAEDFRPPPGTTFDVVTAAAVEGLPTLVDRSYLGLEASLVDGTSLRLTSTARGAIFRRVPATETQADTETLSGADLLVKRGGGTLVRGGESLLPGGAVVEEGLLVVTSNDALGSGPLVVRDGGVVRIESDVLALETLSLEAEAAIDIGTARLVMTAGPPAEAVRQLVLAGRANAVDSPRGILSRDAVPGRLIVGYLTAADGSAVVGLAAPGDTDLDGQVNVFDLITIDGSGTYGGGQAAVWSEGDFTDDGLTNVFDLVAIDGAGSYGAGAYLPAAGGEVAAGAVAAVPEPGPLLAMLSGLPVGLAARRRRLDRVRGE